jgi:hypothetical protein
MVDEKQGGEVNEDYTDTKKWVMISANTYMKRGIYDRIIKPAMIVFEEKHKKEIKLMANSGISSVGF